MPGFNKILLVAFLSFCPGAASAQEALATRSILYTTDDGFSAFDVAASQSRLLVPKFTRYISGPVWDPEGQGLAFVAFDGNERRIWVKDALSEPRALGPNVGRSQIYDIAWAPDGRHLAYQLDGHVVGEGGSYLLSVGASRNERISPEKGHDRYVWWSKDGKRLALASTTRTEIIEGHDTIHVERDSVLQIYDLATKKRTPVAGFEGSIAELSWSPDESMIAFKTGTQLMVIPTAGGKPRKLADGVSNVGPPRWSPDGKTLLVHRYHRAPLVPRGTEGKPKPADQILLITLDGETRELLSYPQNIYHLDWSPDGRQVAFSTSDKKLVLADVMTGRSRILTTAGFWSPVVWASQR